MLRDLRFVHNAAIILMLALSIVGSATAQEADEPLPPVSIPSTEAMHMTATASGHDFVISVGLPWNYKFSEDRYPVVYLLASSVNFGTVTPFTQIAGMFGDLPEMIIVGVEHPFGERWGTEPPQITDAAAAEAMGRDFLPPGPGVRDAIGRDQMLAFLQDDLIPQIDARYRTLQGDRALAGTSASAGFTVYALLNQPLLFNRYLAISPADIRPVITQATFDKFEGLGGADTPLQFYVATGDTGFEALFRDDVRALLSGFDLRGYENLTVYSHFVEGAAHIDIGASGLIRGLRIIYCVDPLSGVCQPQ